MQVVEHEQFRFETEGPIETSVDVLLTHASSDVRSMAACNLKCMGKDARSAIPALEKALENSDEEVRRFAQQALEAIR